MNSDTGKFIIVIGLAVVFIGVVIYFFHDKLHWLGRLPGDIRIERENVRIYFPVTTLILFSLLISGVIALVKRFL